MTKAEAVQEFETHVLPYVQRQYESDGVPDWPARREGWNNWTDNLCKDGRITDYQYRTWVHPPCCGRR